MTKSYVEESREVYKNFIKVGITFILLMILCYICIWYEGV